MKSTKGFGFIVVFALSGVLLVFGFALLALELFPISDARECVVVSPGTPEQDLPPPHVWVEPLADIGFLSLSECPEREDWPFGKEPAQLAHPTQEVVVATTTSITSPTIS